MTKNFPWYAHSPQKNWCCFYHASSLRLTKLKFLIIFYANKTFKRERSYLRLFLQISFFPHRRNSWAVSKQKLFEADRNLWRDKKLLVCNQIHHFLCLPLTPSFSFPKRVYRSRPSQRKPIEDGHKPFLKKYKKDFEIVRKYEEYPSFIHFSFSPTSFPTLFAESNVDGWDPQVSE